MSLTWLIILGICFLIGSSIASVQFLLRSRKKGVITGFLIASIAAIDALMKQAGRRLRWGVES